MPADGSLPDPGDPAASPARPPRRKRYAGTHPRRFEEKYKELEPGRYGAEVEKVLARGQTPAGSHVPILLEEVAAVLSPAPGETVLDCTLGHGGHAERLARLVQPGGRLVGLDLDAGELSRTRARLQALGLEVSAHHLNFAGLGKALAAEGLAGVDCLLADLGVSSMQLDRPARGFSFKADGPLDMRMDQARGATAAEWLAKAPAEDLAAALAELGDEPDAPAVAAAITAAVRAGRAPATTRELVDLVLPAKGVDPRRYRRASAFDQHPAARTFQALRLVVNRELPNLEQLLRLIPLVLKPGGRAAILSFHSGERRRVKQAFRQGRLDGTFSAGNDEPIRPSAQEVHDNPRARSARLDWVRRAPAR